MKNWAHFSMIYFASHWILASFYVASLLLSNNCISASPSNESLNRLNSRRSNCWWWLIENWNKLFHFSHTDDLEVRRCTLTTFNTKIWWTIINVAQEYNSLPMLKHIWKIIAIDADAAPKPMAHFIKRQIFTKKILFGSKQQDPLSFKTYSEFECRCVMWYFCSLANNHVMTLVLWFHSMQHSRKFPTSMSTWTWDSIFKEYHESDKKKTELIFQILSFKFTEHLII